MKRPRLSLRIWKVLEAQAEGLPAIGALAFIVLILMVAKYFAEF